MKNKFQFLIAIFISATFYFFSTGFYDIWFLTWIAPIPILLFSLYERRVVIVFLAALIAYFMGGLNILYYAKTILPIFWFVESVFVEALIFALIVVLNSFIIKRSNHWWSVFGFPCLLVVFEFIISNFSSAGTADSLAYTQFNFLPIIQMASITGIWGITFVLGLFANAITLAWYLRKNKKQMLLGLFVPIFLIILTIGFGIGRLTYSKPIGYIKAGVLSAPLIPHEFFNASEQNAEKTVSRYLKQVPILKKSNVDIILMPEESVITKPSYDPKIIKLFQQAAQKNKLMIVFGVRQKTTDKTKNTAFVISKNGEIVAEYYKHHLVPATEGDFFIGKEIKTFQLNNQLLGISICKDNDFIYPDLLYSQQGIGALLVPAWDFGVDRWLHAKPSFMRGVEGGFSIVRAAQDGYLTVTDECGRMLAIKPTSFQEPISIIVDVPLYSGKTFYSRLGDWFAWLSIITIIILAAVVLLGQKRGK